MVSYWQQQSFFKQQDFIIVGGGLMGLWLAYELKLKYPQCQISILEKGTVPEGASVRNAGFACFGSPTEMLSDVKEMGENAMWKNVEMRYKGIQKIRNILGDGPIGFEQCGGYEVYDNLQTIEEVNTQLNWLNASMKTICGNAQPFNWQNEKLVNFGFNGFKGLIENEYEGGVQSGNLVKSLMQVVTGLGVQYFSNTNVTAIETNDKEVDVVANNKILKAAKVFICTNAGAALLNETIKVTPARGQILLTKPIDNLPFAGTFHYDEGYYYFRNIGNRILLGGARNMAFGEEQTHGLQVTDIIQQALEGFVRNHLYNGPVEIEQRWSGIMAFTQNKMPLLQHINDRLVACIACNGMGVALTPIWAQEVAASV